MCRGRERAAYKKQVLGHVKQTPRFRQVPAKRAYFGRTLGSPPGLPGGGITGVLPVSGVGARISGSTPVGGHNTPLDLASLSARGSPAFPVVEPSGAMVPCRRRLHRRAIGGADGGRRRGLGRWRRRPRRGLSDRHAGHRHQHARQKERVFDPHAGKTASAGGGSASVHRVFRIFGNGSARNAPSAASTGARSG